jgi:uncharacterized OB-fold protein
MTAAAAAGRFELQQCRKCGAVQYPPREACVRCLAVELDWTLQQGGGRMISETTLYHSHLSKTRLPVRIGLVQLHSGPVALVYVGESVAAAPADVQVTVKLDDEGYAVLVAQ